MSISANLLDAEYRAAGTVTLDERVFPEKARDGLLHEAVVMQLACERQGTASTKTRGEVSGGGKKPWRQKGTGRARAGSIRSPIWRGGGTTFGPRPRDYGFRMPRKKVRAALREALGVKAREGVVTVVERLDPSISKTAQVWGLMRALPRSGTTLLVCASPGEQLQRAARNIPGLSVTAIERLSPYQVLRCRNLVIPREDLSRLTEVWGRAEGEPSSRAEGEPSSRAEGEHSR